MVNCPDVMEKPSDADSDFYTIDVSDLPGHSFSLNARLSDIPNGNNYDLHLYRKNGNTFEELDVNHGTNGGSQDETVSFGDNAPDNSGTYGLEVRRVSGASCELYKLEIDNPN